MAKRIYLYKFLRNGLRSQYGAFQWKLNKWYKHEGEINPCHAGFHASVRAIDALGYVGGEILAKVAVRGEHKDGFDKQAWSEMRIVKAYHWTKEDSVELAKFSAELATNSCKKGILSAFCADCAACNAKYAIGTITGVGAAARAHAAATAATGRDHEALNQIEAWIQERIKTLTPWSK